MWPFLNPLHFLNRINEIILDININCINNCTCIFTRHQLLVPCIVFCLLNNSQTMNPPMPKLSILYNKISWRIVSNVFERSMKIDNVRFCVGLLCFVGMRFNRWIMWWIVQCLGRKSRNSLSLTEYWCYSGSLRTLIKHINRDRMRGCIKGRLRCIFFSHGLNYSLWHSEIYEIIFVTLLSCNYNITISIKYQ